MSEKTKRVAIVCSPQGVVAVDRGVKAEAKKEGDVYIVKSFNVCV